jgi:hypothetical protein
MPHVPFNVCAIIRRLANANQIETARGYSQEQLIEQYSIKQHEAFEMHQILHSDKDLEYYKNIKPGFHY